MITDPKELLEQIQAATAIVNTQGCDVPNAMRPSLAIRQNNAKETLKVLKGQYQEWVRCQVIPVFVNVIEGQKSAAAGGDFGFRESMESLTNSFVVDDQLWLGIGKIVSESMGHDRTLGVTQLNAISFELRSYLEKLDFADFGNMRAILDAVGSGMPRLATAADVADHIRKSVYAVLGEDFYKRYMLGHLTDLCSAGNIRKPPMMFFMEFAPRDKKAIEHLVAREPHDIVLGEKWEKETVLTYLKKVRKEIGDSEKFRKDAETVTAEQK